MADGGYRDALTLLEQAILTADGPITLNQVYEQLGLIAADEVDRLLEALMAKDIAIAASLARTHLGGAPMLELAAELYGRLAAEQGEEDLFVVHAVASRRDRGVPA
jgi:DNA polymerase-3 subunit gamma/tau